jgi:hypothetical protein
MGLPYPHDEREGAVLNGLRLIIAGLISASWFVTCAVALVGSPLARSVQGGRAAGESLLGLTPVAWTAIVTLALAVFALVQVCIYAAMHRAAKVAQRGWISVQKLWLNFPSHIEGGRVSVLIHLHNSGQTPVFIDRVRVRLTISDQPLPSQPDYGERDSENPPAVIVAHDTTGWRHHFNSAEFPPDLEGVVISGAKKLWLFGVIDYRDAFGVKHQFGFAYEWDYFKYHQDRGRRAGDLFQHVHDPRYSYAD